ncbi:MAG: phosphatidylglycerophosphatase A [Candidatus Gygaella obscura]|nr:phosphatidylglycerophosphatase A [Candidatus Gygaella obscura]
MKVLVKLITTFFYIGYIPYVSGTMGSLAGIAIYFLVYKNIILYWVVLVIFLLAGFIFSGMAEKIFGKKDPRFVVIDEVCGMLICLCGLKFELKPIVASFLFFRLFDVLKPPPANKFESMRGSLGIMLDDLIASFYTIICVQIVLRLTS